MSHRQNGDKAKCGELNLEFGGGGVPVTYIWGVFDLVVSKVIFGSFNALVSNWPKTLKQLVVEGNRLKFGTQGQYSSNTYMGYLWPCKVQGHFLVIWCTFLKMACTFKTSGRKAKLTEIWDSGILVTPIWGTFDLVVFMKNGKSKKKNVAIA